ncbi:MAG: hypothetical protein KBI35_10165 [Ruminococcus sp.]|nr:hypothetical protein [Ruminococcus sp.]
MTKDYTYFHEDDPFTIPGWVFDLSLDLSTFALALVAVVTSEASDEPGKDYSLFSQLCPLLHPDRSVADHALHNARSFVKALPGRCDFKPDSRNIYEELEYVLRRMLADSCNSEEEFRKLFDRYDYDQILYDIDDFLGEECGSAYPDSPYFALAVALYTATSLHARCDDAVSFMYENLPYVDLAPEDCFDAISDAIKLIDKIGVRALQIKHSFPVLIWYIFKALSDYCEKMLGNGWEFERCSADWSAFDDIPEPGEEEADDDGGTSVELDEAFLTKGFAALDDIFGSNEEG